MRLIDADTLMERIEASWKDCGLHGTDYHKIKRWINAMPTIDADIKCEDCKTIIALKAALEPVKRGKRSEDGLADHHRSRGGGSMTEQDLLIQDLRRANDILREQLAELLAELRQQEHTLAEVREEADRRIKDAEALGR